MPSLMSRLMPSLMSIPMPTSESLDTLDITVEIHRSGNSGGFYAIIVLHIGPKRLKQQRLEGYDIAQEALADAATWISEMIPLEYPNYEYNLVLVSPN